MINGEAETPTPRYSVAGTERPSPVLLARKENPELFQRFTNQYDPAQTCASWIPESARWRWLLLNAWPMHLARVFFRNKPVPQIPLFPDERHWEDKTLTPTIRAFLAFRRSFLMVFLGVAIIILAMGCVQEAPAIVNNLILGADASKKVEHSDVQAMMGIFRAVDVDVFAIDRTSSGASDGGEQTSSSQLRRKLEELAESVGAGTGWLIRIGPVSDQFQTGCRPVPHVGFAESMSQCHFGCAVHVIVSCPMHSHVGCIVSCLMHSVISDMHLS